MKDYKRYAPQLARDVNKYVKVNGLPSLSKFAAEIGVAPTYLHTMLRGGCAPNPRLLDKLGYEWRLVKVKK